MALAKTVALEFRARNKSQRGMRSFQQGIGRTTRSMRGLMRTALAVAGISGFGYMIKRQMEVIDTTAKLSDRLNIGTKALVGLQHGAQISGVETATLNKSLEIFSRRLGEVQMGTGEAKRALDALGVSSRELIGLEMDQAMSIVADQIKGLATQSEKAAVANYLFGRSGQQLLNMFERGSVGIEAFRLEAEKLGLTFSRIDAAKVEAANDALTRTKALFTGLFRQATIELAPYIEAAATSFVNFATSGQGVAHNVTVAFEAVALSVVSTTAEVENLILALQSLTSPIDYSMKLREAEKRATEHYRQMTGEKAAGERIIVPRLGGVPIRRQPKDFDLYNKILLEEKAALGLIAENRESVIREAFNKFRTDAEARATLAADTSRTIANNEIAQTQITTEAHVTLWQRAMDRRNELWLSGLTKIEAMERDKIAVMGWVMDHAKGRWQTFWDPVIDGQKSAKAALNDFFQTFFLNIAKAQMQLAMMQIWQAAVGPLLSGVAGAFFPGAASAPVVFEAHGDAFQSGKVMAMAAGGIVNAPTVFPMARGQYGLMGEAGPEAVLPLRRGSGGRLGVELAGKGGGTTNINVNITAMDSQSIERALAKKKNFLADLMIGATKGNHPFGRYER